MSEVSLPPAPSLEGDLILDVFLHPSLRQEGLNGDNDRYKVLGEQVFYAAITNAIFRRFPMYRGHEIVEERNRQLSDENYEHWTVFYRFREKLRYPASANDEVHSPKGARDLFHAYVGGVFTLPSGPDDVSLWAYNLIAPPEARIIMPKQEQLMYQHSPPPPSAPYPMAPPPPPGQSYVRNRTSSFSIGRQGGLEDTSPHNTTGKVVFLPRFNEICTQKRLNVQYPAEQGGLQHAPRWVVNCIVDGVQRGQGTATTKQLAKEEAARQAWSSFGWAMREYEDAML